MNLMNTRTLIAALAGAALFAVAAAPAHAQTAETGTAPAATDADAAPAKSKAKTPVGAPVTVTVTNSRKADLVQLQAAEPGSANWKNVLGAVKAGVG